MIRLDSTLRKLQIILGGAVTTNQLPVTVCYSDKTLSDYAGATQVSLTNGGTAVDICAAPAASTVRDTDSIIVYNADTATANVTIRYNDNSTLYTLFQATLAVGDQLLYAHGQGWKVLNLFGAVKTSETVVSSAFSASGSAGTITAGGGFIPTALPQTGDTSNAYNPSTGAFTAPISGWYQFNATLELTSAGTSIVEIICIAGGVVHVGFNSTLSAGQTGRFPLAFVASLLAGQTATMFVACSVTNASVTTNSEFSGFFARVL